MKLRTTRGESFEESVAIPRGFAGSGGAESLRKIAREKYCRQAAGLIGDEKAAQAADLLERLEELGPDEVMQLVQLNCAVTQ